MFNSVVFEQSDFIINHCVESEYNKPGLFSGWEQGKQRGG